MSTENLKKRKISDCEGLFEGHIFCLKQLPEKSVFHSRELHLIFIDFQKVRLLCLRRICRMQRIIRMFYGRTNAAKQSGKDAKTLGKVGDEILEELLVNKGLRHFLDTV